MTITASWSPRGATLGHMPVIGPRSDSAAPAMLSHGFSPNGAQKSGGVPGGGTGTRKDAPRAACACKGGGCGPAHPEGESCAAMVRKSNKTGKCRACWRAGLGAEGRKTEPEELLAMQRRMFTALLRRAAGEDAGRSLPLLLAWEAELGALVNDAGVEMYRQFLADKDADKDNSQKAPGPQGIADDLTRETGRVWDRRMIVKRWGRGSPAWLARYPETSTEAQNGEVRGDE